MKKWIIVILLVVSFGTGIFVGKITPAKYSEDVGEFSYESGFTSSVLEYVPINSEEEFKELLNTLAGYSYNGTLHSMSFRVVNGETVGLLIYRTPY